MHLDKQLDMSLPGIYLITITSASQSGAAETYQIQGHHAIMISRYAKHWQVTAKKTIGKRLSGYFRNIAAPDHAR